MFDWSKWKNAKGIYWNPQKENETILGTIVKIYEETNKFGRQQIRVRIKTNENEEKILPAHANLLRQLAELNIQENDKVRITYLGKEIYKNRLISQYKVEKIQ
jgi:hypothetical protein